MRGRLNCNTALIKVQENKQLYKPYVQNNNINNNINTKLEIHLSPAWQVMAAMTDPFQ